MKLSYFDTKYSGWVQLFFLINVPIKCQIKEEDSFTFGDLLKLTLDLIGDEQLMLENGMVIM